MKMCVFVVESGNKASIFTVSPQTLPVCQYVSNQKSGEIDLFMEHGAPKLMSEARPVLRMIRCAPIRLLTTLDPSLYGARGSLTRSVDYELEPLVIPRKCWPYDTTF